MRFVLAGYGSRGDVEPCAAIGRELLRRNHAVCMAVPPNLLDFIKAAGLAGVAYGPDSGTLSHDEQFVDKLSSTQNPISLMPEAFEHVTQAWAEKNTTLASLTDGADLLLAGITEQRLAGNVAEYQGIPLVALHFFPAQILPIGWLHEQITRMAEDAQRRALGLPEALRTSPRLMLNDRWPEIQAYEEFCVPGLADQWAKDDGHRPFIGALTLELPTDADDEVLSWIGAGTPPIYFGFGSTPVASPADVVATISAACAQLGERALICTGGNDFADIPHPSQLKIVSAVNHGAILRACRAVVHHGGAGTTAAGMRAGIPALILWLWLDQPIWAAAVEQLKVGVARRFSATTLDSLVADLRIILTPQYATRAREAATRMTKPAESVARAADLLENTVRRGPVS